HVLLDRGDRLLHDGDDLLPRRVAEQGREGDRLPPRDHEPADGEVHHVHPAPAPLDLPPHRPGDLLLQERLRGAALREDGAVRAEEYEAKRVRRLPGPREVPPERRLEGEGPKSTPEGRDPV